MLLFNMYISVVNRKINWPVLILTIFFWPTLKKYISIIYLLLLTTSAHYLPIVILI